MKIVVDDKIPYIREALSKIGAECIYIKGVDISSDDVRDADALVVRTRTRCDEALLSGSKVRFVATATIGIDHLDVDYMERAGIRWVNCPGCNAGSVAQYVETTLLRLEESRGEKARMTGGQVKKLREMTLGIVGCGHVGSKVKAMAESKLGMKVIVNDPLVGASGYVGLSALLRDADIITFHVPLTRDGDYPTWHLADRRFMEALTGRSVCLINTSRGGVVDEQELLKAMADGRVTEAVIDTWEHEPDINRELLAKAFVATPHIAGYSADGKVTADNMVLDALCSFFGLEHPGRIVPPPLPDDFIYTGDALQLYDPLKDTSNLRAHPENFEELRGNYPVRREQWR